MKRHNILPVEAATSTVGFWSNREVLVNAADDPIWLGRHDMAALVETLESSVRDSTLHYFRLFADRVGAIDFTTHITGSVAEVFKLYSLVSPPVWAEFSRQHGSNYTAAHKKFSAYMAEAFSTPQARSDAFYSALVAHSENQWPPLVSGDVGFRVDTPATMLRVDWRRWLASFDEVAEALSVMLYLSAARKEFSLSTTKRFKGQTDGRQKDFDGLAAVAATVPVTNDAFRVEARSSANVAFQAVRGICAAMTWAALMLCRERHLLLPIAYTSIRPATSVAAQAQWADMLPHLSLTTKASRSVFSRLVQSTTASGAEDISVDLCRILISNSRRMAGATIKGVAASMRRYELAHPDAPPFPIAQVNIRRQLVRKEDTERIWSPERLRIAGFPDWAQAAEVYYQNFQSELKAASATIGRLLGWAMESGRQSPWQIRPIDLIDPLQPNSTTTFHSYLYRTYGDRNLSANAWWEASRFYAMTINALKPLPAFETIIGANPFEGLTNPFRKRHDRTPIGKTFRRLMPVDHLSAMLDTLLEPDEAGIPTFEWVKKRFAIDSEERYNHQTKHFEEVWHPARAICLAILLLIPIRGKQARWLDQGLMDKMRWNLDTDAWERNTHPLRRYKYPDGTTHEERYGRCSGVLQPVESILGGNVKHIGLYISTNKTQLWNPDARAGYAIPWPDGSELLEAEDPRVRHQGWRLGLVYTLIKQQLQWLERYDPRPIPIDFTVDGERYAVAIAKRFPHFCPIFRDLTSPAESAADKRTIYPPVSKQKIESLYHAIAEETERRLIERGYPKESIGLTRQEPNSSCMVKLGRPAYLTRCAYDIHSLRVAGITHLLEMGVPAHIVSEFIAGHMALVMTLHYAKFQPLKLRQKILDAFREADAIDRFESLLGSTGVDGVSSLLVRNRHFSEREAPPIGDLLGAKGVWRYINGGICPGAACDEGGAQLARKESTTKTDYTDTAVLGGAEACGNCRFFLTGPAFLIPQMLAANSIMLKMRQLGHTRKMLWDDKAALELAAFEKAGSSAMPSSELATITGELERIDRALEPMILEWCNRYEMFQSSLPLLDEWNRLSGNAATREHGKLVLFGAASQDDFAANLDPTGCDFSLAKQIVLQSELLGGRRMVNELADFKLREFVDRILVRNDVRDLMIGIADDKQRRTAALMMAETISVFAGGDRAVQDALDRDGVLNATPEQHAVLADLARSVSGADGIDLGQQGILKPIQLLENAT